MKIKPYYILLKWNMKHPENRNRTNLYEIWKEYDDGFTFDTAWSPPEEICEALRSKYENKSEQSYSNGLFISVNWFYELEGEEGCGYL